MDEFYFTKQLEGNRKLCLASLSNRRLANADHEVSDPSGYFLYEQEGTGEFATVTVIAKVVSDAAAFALRDLFEMA